MFAHQPTVFRAPAPPAAPAPQAPLRKMPADELDEFLSSDLDLSFASSVSLHSPPRNPAHFLAPPQADSPNAMDISPAVPLAPRNLPFKVANRPRSHTSSSGSRLFRDASNDGSGVFGSQNKPFAPPPAPARQGDANESASAAGRRLNRPGLPSAWVPAPAPAPAPVPVQVPPSPASSDFAMDVDTTLPPTPAPARQRSKQDLYDDQPLSAASTVTATSFRDLPSWREQPWSAAPPPGAEPEFQDLSSPPRPPSPAGKPPSRANPFFPPPGGHKKRRSASPDVMVRSKSSFAGLFAAGSPTAVDDTDVPTSPAAPSSPVDRKLRRMASGSLLSQFSAAAALEPSPMLAPSKKLRRPGLNAFQAESASPAFGHAPRHASYGGGESISARLPAAKRENAAPPRRAFSAMLGHQPTREPVGRSSLSGQREEVEEEEEEHEDESSFDVSVDMSSPAQAYTKRLQTRALRRDEEVIGRPVFLPPAESPASARYMQQSGMPGFGDNEMHGKILPCHRVKEDGLVRITPETLNNLLDGKYADRITEFHVIDCRFDYEYAGGHVPGAVNINTTQGVEEFLLRGGEGGSVRTPKPCTSADRTRKTVLVFHCEFSAKRAPTFAKHLRAKDRLMNQSFYPKIHYPEVYVLEGGYCQYFKASGSRCVPPNYVRMDDPSYAVSRQQDLDHFRKGKFGRTKSYAYGDVGAAKVLGPQQQQQQQQQVDRKEKRADAGRRAAMQPMSGISQAFSNAANAGAGQTRVKPAQSQVLMGGTLRSLAEDGDMTEGEDTDLGDSPCPPPPKVTAYKAIGKKRAPLARSETTSRLGF